MAAQRPFRFAVHAARAQDGRAWMDQARRFERIGFSTLLLRDHLDDQLAPVSAMTAAAMATASLRVGCLVFANDYRNPAVLAKELATIDLLSGGRVEVGLGAGWMASDYAHSGIPFDPPGTRVSRLMESIEVMKALWSDGPVQYRGTYYQVEGNDGLPKPVQRPRPPLLVGGGSRRLLKFAGQEADIVGINMARPRNDSSANLDLTEFSAEAVDTKIGWIRQGAGGRFDNLELSIIVRIVATTDDRRDFAQGLVASLGSENEHLRARANRALR